MVEQSNPGSDVKPVSIDRLAFPQGDSSHTAARFNVMRTRLHQLASTPISNGPLTDLTPRVLADIEEAMAAAGVVAGGEVAADAATAAAAAITGIVSVTVLIIILIVIAVLLFIEAVLSRVGSMVPFAGDRAIVPWIHIHFRWLDNVENVIVQRIADTVGGTVHQWIGLLRIFLQLEGFLPETSTVTVTKVQDRRTQVEINHLQAQINYLMSHMGSVEYVTNNKRVVVGVPQNVWDDIHELNRQVVQLRNDLTSVQSQVDNALHIAQSTANQIGNVSSTIHEVRAISVGWSDIQSALDRLTTTVTTIQNNTSERLDNQSRQITQLAPLTILTGGGMRGLKTLRQLEDTPCMCPKMPGLPRLGAEKLAIYEFITNG